MKERNTGLRRCWLTVLLGAAFFACSLPSFATTISLYLYTGYVGEDYAQLQDSVGNPLSDGSYVMIVGSLDNAREELVHSGTNYQSLVTNDTIIGTFALDTGEDGGWFDAAGYTYDSTLVHYIYIYFFDSQGFPIVGLTDYGYSTVLDATGWNPVTYSISLDITQGSNLQVSETENFIVIPEPSTGSLLMLFLGMGLVGMPGLWRACSIKEPKAPGGGSKGRLL